MTLTCDGPEDARSRAVIREVGQCAHHRSINYGHSGGDTAVEEIWDALGDLVSTPVDGMPIKLAFIDSGFRPGKTDTLPVNRIYEPCLAKSSRRASGSTKGSCVPMMRTPLPDFQNRAQVRADGKAAKYVLTLQVRHRSLEKSLGGMNDLGGLRPMSAGGMFSPEWTTTIATNWSAKRD